MNQDFEEPTDEVFIYLIPFYFICFKKFSKKLLRCLNSISFFLNESEKNGVGGLASHSSLIKGEIYAFKVQNEISNDPKSVEIFIDDNKTVYELRE